MNPVAAVTRTVRYIKLKGTYLANLEVSRGDLYQLYDGANVTPVYSPQDPAVVKFRLFDTSKGTYHTFDPAKDGQDYEVRWYLGEVATDKEISFDAATGLSTGVKDPLMAGVFLKEPGGVLKIVGNLAAALGYVSSYLMCKVVIADGNGGSDSHFAHKAIDIVRAVDNTWLVSILGEPSLITTSADPGEAGYRITLKAQVFEGLNPVTSGLTYSWKKWDTATSAWVEIGTDPTLTLTADDIRSSEFIRVDVSRNGSVVGSDTETVYDDSDPLVINANPNPADETIYGDTSKNGQVVYSPLVCSRANPGTDLKPGQLFDFDLFDANGVNISGANTKGVSTLTVDRALCALANSDVEVYITAYI